MAISSRGEMGVGGGSRGGSGGGSGRKLIKSSVKSGAKILGPAAAGAGATIAITNEDKKIAKQIAQQKKDKALMEKLKNQNLKTQRLLYVLNP
jgi:hypothetical protein